MSGWSGFALVGEACRNLAARPARFLILLVITVAVLLSVALGELYTARRVETASAELIAEGYTTVKVMNDPDGIPARDCARLEGQQGIVAAGGVGNVTTTIAGSSPGLSFWEASSVGNVVGVLTGHGNKASSQPGILLSNELAEQLGVGVGSHLDIGGTLLGVAGIFPFGERDQLLGRIALIPSAPTGTLHACYVQFTSGNYLAGATALTGAFEGLQNLTVGGLVARGPGASSPASSWKNRSSRWGWLTAGLILGAVELLAARSRYHELSVYVVTGSWRSEVAIIYLSESELLLALATLFTIAWTAFLAVMAHAGWGPFHAALIGMSRAMVLAAATTPLGLIPLFRRNLGRLLLERSS